MAALPCQYDDNCINEGKEAIKRLPPYAKKSRYRLIQVIEWMVTHYGLNHVGLLTLTFGVPGSGRGSQATRELREQAKDLEFVQERWHSFNTNVIARRYPDWVCILETHRDGVWHLHVVVATAADIRTGTDVETLTNYKLPAWQRRGSHLRNDALAAEWKALREVCCKYRFGRVELMPVRKTGAALARYLAGYLAKTLQRHKTGRKSRLVRFSRGLSNRFTLRFTVWNLGNLIHRTRLKMAARMLQFDDYGDFADYFGPRWHYYLGSVIAEIPIPFRFANLEFEQGVAALFLNHYANKPHAYLNEKQARQLAAVDDALFKKFADLAFEDDAGTRRCEPKHGGADNVDVGPLTTGDLQTDLMADPNLPF